MGKYLDAVKATTKGSLKIHRQSQHDGILYDCNDCDYKATNKVNLSTVCAFWLHPEEIHLLVIVLNLLFKGVE